MRIKSANSEIEAGAEWVAIRHTGLVGAINHGLSGEKRIPYSSIAAVQFKKPGAILAGFLQLTVKGGVEAKGGVRGATKDENTVMFRRNQLREYEQLRALIEQRMASSGPAAAPTSLADELGKLADLRDRGVLSNEEFEQQKAALLARA